MQHITGHGPTATDSIPWPASYRGRGIWIDSLPNGWFVGLVEGGYRSQPYPDAQQALADITDWIDCQQGGTSHA